MEKISYGEYPLGDCTNRPVRGVFLTDENALKSCANLPLKNVPACVKAEYLRVHG